jgi:hypothetical protein
MAGFAVYLVHSSLRDHSDPQYLYMWHSFAPCSRATNSFPVVDSVSSWAVDSPVQVVRLALCDLRSPWASMEVAEAKKPCIDRGGA